MKLHPDRCSFCGSRGPTRQIVLVTTRQIAPVCTDAKACLRRRQERKNASIAER